MSQSPDYSIPEWPYAYGGPAGSGDLKSLPDDFVVTEFLPFTPEGEGEHVFLQVEKCGENTEYVARVLARAAGIRQRDVGFAGLKDRHARATQWFSLWLPGRDEPDWSAVESDSIAVLQSVRHARKLKRGVLAGNHFRICLRHWQGERTATEDILRQIERSGYPNYFAEQRFGRKGLNVVKGLELAEGKKCKRELRSVYLSALRAFLFNQILAERLRLNNWNTLLNGEICQLRHSRSTFRVEAADDKALRIRLDEGDISPTGSLWGEGENAFAGDTVGEIERRIVERFPEATSVIKTFGMKSDRRALSVRPENMKWSFDDGGELKLEFALPPGSYATALLREIGFIDKAPVSWQS